MVRNPRISHACFEHAKIKICWLQSMSFLEKRSIPYFYVYPAYRMAVMFNVLFFPFLFDNGKTLNTSLRACKEVNK